MENLSFPILSQMPAKAEIRLEDLRTHIPSLDQRYLFFLCGFHFPPKKTWSETGFREQKHRDDVSEKNGNDVPDRYP